MSCEGPPDIRRPRGRQAAVERPVGRQANEETVMSPSPVNHPSPGKGRGLRGFTLVELLGVIAIIALLIRILIPALQKTREQARQVACASNLKQLYNSIHIYSTVYNGYVLPAPGWSGVGGTTISWCAS